MRNFTIFKTGSQRGVNTFMLEGAPIEHPLSIRSASVGTSRKPAGNTAIIRCMAAMFVLLFTLGVGNAWGANTWYTWAVHSVCLNGDRPTNAISFHYATTASQTPTILDTEWKTDTTYTPTSGSGTKTMMFGAKAIPGYQFDGWYTNAECTDTAVNVYTGTVTYYGEYKNNYYHYKKSVKSAPSATTLHFYAKYTKNASSNLYKPQLTVTSSNFNRGGVGISLSAPDPSVAITNQFAYKSITSEDDTITQSFYIRAVVMRGYKFIGWTKSSDRVSIADASALSTTCVVTLNKDMTTKDDDGNIVNDDVLTANYALDNTYSFQIIKEAYAGKITTKCLNNYATYLYPHIMRDTTRQLVPKEGGGYDIVYGCTKGVDEGCKDTTISIGRDTTLNGYIFSSEYSIPNMDSISTSRNYSGYYSTDKLTFTAVPSDGYLFSGWYVRRTNRPDSLIAPSSLETPTKIETYLFEDGLTFVPVFVIDPSGLVNANDYFVVGESACQTLEQAIAAATQSQHKTIVQLKDYTVPAGNYTIPPGVTLLIPYKDNYLLSTPLERSSSKAVPTGAYRTLTLEDGAHLEVYGTIEVGGLQSTGGGTAIGEQGIGCPTGEYGCLQMNGSSSITLNNGAKLYAWGYILGQRENGKYLCEIDARRGSEVREQFQIMDWKGGSYTTEMFNGNNSDISDPNSFKVLPINQYYIQNIEIPVKYRPGAKLSGAGSVAVTFIGDAAPSTVQMDNAGIIGAKYTNKQDDAIFLMNDEDDSEDTWVRKYYDITTDQQVYEINNAAYIGCLVLNLGGYTADSREYKLPITNNFKIHLLSGNMKVTQHTEFLAGSELIVNKKSRMVIPEGVNVYLYDKEDWGRYITTGSGKMGSGTTVKWIPAIPGVREAGRPNVRRDAAPNDTVKISDTKFIISGTLDVQGKLFTTSHGASIISTNEDAGTIIFSSDAPVDNYVYQLKSPSLLPSDDAYQQIQCTSAQLQNEDGSLTKTYTNADHHAVSGQSYCFINGAWRNFIQEDGCFMSETVNEVTTYYAKPQDLVALTSGTEDENHLFHELEGNRTFINTTDNDGNCQWWDVKATTTPGIYHCEHPKNDVYYYYDDDTYYAWREKKFKVSWVNWDGSPVNYTNSEDEEVNYYMVSYKSIPQWLSANPTRVYDASHEYTFDGWTPDLAPVTADVTYMATYQERDRMYAITFNNESDELIQVLYCKLGEMPVCDKYDAAANNKEWTPALGAVAGNQVYKLQDKNVVGPFTIRFVNWDGEELQSGSVELNGTPIYSGATPSKPADDSHAYTFVGWTPSVTPATQNMTYTAKFDVQQLTGLNVVDAQTITTDLVIPDVRITTTGSLNVTGSITANNFILESNGNSASGQIVGGYASIEADHIYFDFKVNAKNHKWYGVAVPWEVDATSGISVNGKTLVLGKDFDIVYYNGALRAEVGKQKCWSYVEDDGDKTLVPGRLYMIGLMMDAPQGIRFVKKTGEALLTTTTSVTAHTSAVATDANWNGVANPALFHAFVNAGADDATYGPNIGQVYNPDTKSYSTIDMSAAKFVVGQGAFVQGPNAGKAITVTYGGAYAAAPRRARAEEAPLYDVRIAPAEAEYTDRLFVTVDDEKEADTYVIGKDLEKLGVSKSVAQMWINRYNTELCLNTMTIENGAAEYPLGIFAPKAGEYTISSQSSVFSDQYTLYLTFNGEAIWNLSDAAYTGTFDAGTTSAYGLRISARAPQITTGIDEAVVDAKGETRKVLIDNQVFIIRGENVYSVDGQLVK